MSAALTACNGTRVEGSRSPSGRPILDSYLAGWLRIDDGELMHVKPVTSASLQTRLLGR